MSEERKKVILAKIEVTDLIRAIAAHDPVREHPEYKRLLDMPWEEYEKELEALKPSEG